MKRLFIILAISCLSVLSTYAQEPLELTDSHLTFKGVEIDGSLKDFSSKLIEQGYVISESDDECVVFKGSFGGDDDCMIGVYTTPNTKKVYTVIVALSITNSWTSLKSDYNEYKTMLTAKYGKPDKSIERFKDPYYEGDGYELQAFRLDKATYLTHYNASNGTILVHIGHFLGGARVCLSYTDNINGQLNKREINTNKYGDL